MPGNNIQDVETDQTDGEIQAAVLRKHKTLQEYWKMRQDSKWSHMKARPPCNWCKKFRPVGVKTCLDCGAILNEDG